MIFSTARPPERREVLADGFGGALIGSGDAAANRLAHDEGPEVAVCGGGRNASGHAVPV